MKHESCKILIIGAGPGGYVCAIRAGQLGLDTIVVEEARAGGTCLNIGCIPSKALIHAAEEFHVAAHLAAGNDLGITTTAPAIDLRQTVAWKDGIVKRLTGGVGTLLKKARVRSIAGRAQIVDGKTVDVETADGPLRITTENLVIATGSHPQTIPALPFGGDILSSTEALSLDAVPARLAVVGGGYIGLEIGTAMAKLGAQVTVVEAAGRILPQYDAELTRPVMQRLEALGVTVLCNARAEGFETGHLVVATDDGPQKIAADKVLVTVGRAPVTQGFGLEDLGLTMTGRHLDVDDRCRTSMHGVYAIGDVTGDPMLAHRAMAQGTLVAEAVAGYRTNWDKRAIPAVCFTDPEIVTVGLLPEETPDSAVAMFPFAGNGRAMTLGRDDGFVRVVYDADTELVLGIQAVGAGVSELAGEFALALEMAATLTDIADTVHAHPTLGETVQEVAMKGLGRALHI
ncbi:dihydrolipoyl dehydrogenase [Pseudosulfitobacter sp. DSM 107133]|uniref:dihydrolipoyl dehydrogenase n=1 Tax=Pseudosulfitobacter sp. DSM 107133 TaxID=2883100 RepID=UPI000DF491EF|nr:dihydrolipoyl dehydrogenase [Pseudosulfitobacter sp. DSM 107133]UOA29216.1 Dihydrolipoyl dehydrogenase [Pseudosulfitobacter sp. DSM 107133]